MIQATPKSEATGLAELELYAYLLRKSKTRLQMKDRIEFLKQTPGALTIDDLDALREYDGRARRRLFEAQPEIREQYEEYCDTPEKVLGSLHEFVRRSFRHCGLGGKYNDNWHMKVLCDEWERAINHQTMRLLINQPPDTSKSHIANIAVPAYAFAKDPNWSVIEISYNEDLPRRDGETLLRLMNSDWYRRRFPHVRIRKGNNEYFETTQGGYRRGSTIGASVTGWHPRMITFDDPSRATDVSSKKMMNRVVSYYAKTIPSRGSGMSATDVRKTSVAVVMQRLAPNDLCGLILNEEGFDRKQIDAAASSILAQEESGGLRWRHVCLPMFYDRNHPYPYEYDPRTTDGEILLTGKAEAEIRARMREMEMDPEGGGQTVTAQFQQDPLASHGAMFVGLDEAFIGFSDYANLRLVEGRAVRCWDRADSLTGDSTAGVLMIEKGGVKYIADVIVFQKRHLERDNLIEQAAKIDASRFDNYRVAIERPSGPDGQSAFDATRKRLRENCSVETMAVPALKSKVDRATPLAGAIKYGECRILDGKPWKGKLNSEFRLFPMGAHDDIVDAASGAMWALNKWANNGI